MMIRMSAAAALLVSALALGATGSMAQTTTGTIAQPDEAALAEEHEAALRDYVQRRPVERIVAIPGETVRPGKLVPRGVRLSPLANIPVASLSRYAYVVSPDDKIVVVDPATRRVVRVVDR